MYNIFLINVKRSYWAVGLCVILSTAGLLLCGYLGFLHLTLMRGDLLAGPLCGGFGGFVDCHSVIAGRFAKLLGVPLAFWGLLGYLMVFNLSILAALDSRLRDASLQAIAVLSLVFLAADLRLLNVMIQIGRICPLCISSYVLNLSLLFLSKWGLGRPWRRLFEGIGATVRSFLPVPGSAAGWAFWGVPLAGVLGVVSVHATAEYMASAPGSLRERMKLRIQQASRIEVNLTNPPVLGSPEAPIQIVEFIDFLCPSCQEAARFNRVNLANYRGQVALWVHHFPLDKVCNPHLQRSLHPGACLLAAAVECARQQGQFWPLHDRIIFRKTPAYGLDDLEGDAAQVGLDMERFRGCMAGNHAMEAIQTDIEEAGRWGIVSTPTFVVNGIVIRGAITPDQFEEMVRNLKKRRRS